jgi:hypothetical protein
MRGVRDTADFRRELALMVTLNLTDKQVLEIADQLSPD